MQDNFPRVTEVISILSLPSIMAWERRVGLYTSQDIREISMGIGKKVDECVGEFFASGKIPEDEPFKSIIKKFEKFCEEFVLPENLIYQLSGVNKEHGFRGTADILYEDGESKWLVDIKVAKEVRETYIVQLSAYANLDEIKEIAPSRFAIWLYDKTTSDWRFIEVFPEEDHFNLFLSALRIFKWALREGNTFIPNLTEDM